MADPSWAPLLLDTARADPAAAAACLEEAWKRQRLVALAGPGQQGDLAQALGGATQEMAALARFGAAVVVGSGGSAGGRHWCLQPLAHLQASAEATASWLVSLGLEPSACLHLDPLPLHHVSGLLPLVRARHWGASGAGWPRRCCAGRRTCPRRAPCPGIARCCSRWCPPSWPG